MTKLPKNIFLPETHRIKDEITRIVLEQFSEVVESLQRDAYDDLKTDVRTFPVNDVTPSVKNGKTFVTANTGATAITDMNGAEAGQVVTIIINDTNTSIADGGNFKLSAAFNPDADDTIQLVFFNSLWYEISRSSN